MPIQTTGFYNSYGKGRLQFVRVVIPIQTTGFYNEVEDLVPGTIQLSYPSKRQASTTDLGRAMTNY